MTGDGILQLFAYLLPAVVTGAIAFYFFRMHTNNEEGRRRYLLHKDSQKHAMPIRLQAYERMALFLERIAIPSLVVRVAPRSADKNEYENLLIKTNCTLGCGRARQYGCARRAGSCKWPAAGGAADRPVCCAR